jgi:two-component system OmpR family sensor kinase
MRVPFCRSLYGKISVVLFFLFIGTVVLNIALTLFATRQHMQETTQRIHRGLAKYLVEQNLFIREGAADKQALMSSFGTLMHINPNLELYLLDTEGNIIAYSAEPGKVKLKSVSLEPVLKFLKGGQTLPLEGDDPRSPGTRKVFSAAPVPLNGPPEGYLYIILTGQEYDSAAAMLQTSYIVRLSIGTAALVILFIFAATMLLFYMLTKRLSSLAASVDSFQSSGFTKPLTFASGRAGDDEIDRLGSAFQHMSERIVQQVVDIKRVDMLRRELVTNVSHDLRTPLASLLGYLETLIIKEDGMTHEEKLNHLETALRQAKHLNKLISELFDLARLDSGEATINPESFNLIELVGDIVQTYTLEAERRGIRLEAEFPEELPFVFADIGLIERAIRNLLDNGIRFAGPDGALGIRLSQTGDSVVVQVSDTGAGIPEDELPLIFDRFYRARRDRNREGKSTGLGLAITKRIIELHNSTISVTSGPAEGTTFSFSLPIMK